jgi:hypothetical protein
MRAAHTLMVERWRTPIGLPLKLIAFGAAVRSRPMSLSASCLAMTTSRFSAVVYTQVARCPVANFMPRSNASRRLFALCCVGGLRQSIGAPLIVVQIDVKHPLVFADVVPSHNFKTSALVDALHHVTRPCFGLQEILDFFH